MKIVKKGKEGIEILKMLTNVKCEGFEIEGVEGEKGTERALKEIKYKVDNIQTVKVISCPLLTSLYFNKATVVKFLPPGICVLFFSLRIPEIMFLIMRSQT